MPASGLRLRGAVSSKEHNHEVSGNSDTDRVRNLDLPTSTGSKIAAALTPYACYITIYIYIQYDMLKVAPRTSRH